MNYSVPCECDRTLTVAATAAGATAICDCGRAVQIPLLSELRLSAAEDAYGRNTVETIWKMVHDRELPSGEICAVSGKFTKDIAILCIECERVHRRREWWDTSERMFFATVIRFLFLGAIGVLLGPILRFRGPRREADTHQEHGRDVAVQAPLYVCSSLHAQLRKQSQRELKKLLSQTPIYATLLKEYPDATVLFARSVPHQGDLLATGDRDGLK